MLGRCKFKMDVNKELKKITFTDIMKKDGYKKVIIIAGFLGIILIFLSGFFKENNKPKEKVEEIPTTQQYSKQIEESLTEIVSHISGAGESKVLVTVENSVETVYATAGKKNTEASEDKIGGETTKRKESDDSETQYITVKDSDGTEKALAITEIQPTIKGVVVVCSGGDDPSVCKRVTDAVTTALNITSKRVCVTKLS